MTQPLTKQPDKEPGSPDLEVPLLEGSVWPR